MRAAATSLGRQIVPLPQEWWDFREPESVWGQYEPLREVDLLPAQRLIDVDPTEIQKILNKEYPPEMQSIINELKA